MLGEVSMTWWVSATVLCATIVGVTWTKRDEIIKAGRGAVVLLFSLGLVFFISICGYGVTAIRGAVLIRDALLGVCGPGAACTQADAESICSTAIWGIGIGTTSFVIFAITWTAVAILTWIEAGERTTAPTPPSTLIRSDPRSGRDCTA